MKKLLGVLLSVIVIGGAGYYLYMQSSGKDVSEPASEGVMESDVVVDDEETSAPSGSGTLKSLLALGQNLTCDFSYTEPESGSQTEGTTYIADENMRGDFTMTQDGEEYTMSAIHDGEFVYTWGSGPMGAMAMKFPVDDTEVSSETSVRDNDPLQSDDEVEYDCRRWSVDSSKFVPPSDIEFQDIGMQIQQINSGSGDLKAAQCAACDQVPAEARAQCLEALGC
jgi:hypothetical protein